MYGKEILITGGTGTLANALVRYIKAHYKPRGIRLFSRSELRQAEMREALEEEKLCDKVEFIVGDVRDEKKVELATRGVDIIIHAAAMKRVDTAEKDPLECVNINVHGTENIVYNALKNRVKKAILVSTDKAFRPVTLYGATKMCAEGLFKNAGVYSGRGGTTFAIVRYGKVFDSNGSVVRIFRRQAESGVVTVTDAAMTRFWIKKEEVCEFICKTVNDCCQGRVYFPIMRSSRIIDLAKVLAPNAKIEYIGKRCDEKYHEEIYEGIHSNNADLLMNLDELRGYVEQG